MGLVFFYSLGYGLDGSRHCSDRETVIQFGQMANVAYRYGSWRGSAMHVNEIGLNVCSSSDSFCSATSKSLLPGPKCLMFLSRGCAASPQLWMRARLGWCTVRSVRVSFVYVFLQLLGIWIRGKAVGRYSGHHKFFPPSLTYSAFLFPVPVTLLH